MIDFLIFFKSTVTIGLIIISILSIFFYLNKRNLIGAILLFLSLPTVFVLMVYLSTVTEVFYSSRINVGGMIFICLPLCYGLYLYFFDSEFKGTKTFYLLSLISSSLFYFTSFYHPYGGEETIENHRINKHVEVYRIDCMNKIEDWLVVNGIERYGYESNNNYLYDISRDFTLKIIIEDSKFNRYIFNDECEYISKLN